MKDVIHSLRLRGHALALGGVLLVAQLAACGSDGRPTPLSSQADGGASVTPGAPGFGNANLPPATDFPTPIVEPGAPPDALQLFAQAQSSGAPAPCVIEPEPGTLYPRNWIRPRFTWTASGANVYELRLTAKNQTRDLLVYTTQTTWTMPKAMWDALRAHSADVPMSVSVRGAAYGGGRLANVSSPGGGDLGIAPVEAPGSIVFWAIQTEDEESGDGKSMLKGFTVGEEGLVDVVTGNQLPAYGQQGRQCFGCHTSTPDGKSVGVTWEVNGEDYAVDVARIEKGQPAGPSPTFVSPAAKGALASGGMFSAFSPAFWSPGNRLMLTNRGPELAWIDLEATSPNAASGVLGRVGDPNQARISPSWSRDGSFIAYMSGSNPENPFELSGPADIYLTPFANRAGATSAAPAVPLAGASDPNRAEYYPAVSPDGAFVAFNAIEDNGRVYDNPNAELFMVSRNGGGAYRLNANDPPACSPRKSPGITNSWPKWAPEAREDKGRKFYFLVFSSRRHLGTEKPQLYVAPVAIDSAGKVYSYRALYLWNQESEPMWQTWGNHTPSWDVFAIPAAAPK